MRFEFATSNRILFGPGRSEELGELAQPLGQRALVVVDSVERSESLFKSLEAKAIAFIPYLISGEPTIDSVCMTLVKAKQEKCDLIISIGGGSALDTGKAAAALLANPGELSDFLEVIGKGKPLTHPSIPFIAIPTTAGTGSEVTRNAVISSPEKQVKASLRSPFMLPRIAIVDPELTYSLPPKATASTGMDALTQLIEPFTSSATNPLVDGFCREGIPLIAQSLLNAYQAGQDSAARENMALASLLGGLALANGRLGAVHGMANPVGGMSHAPHGAICARLLPMVMEMNIRALKTRAPDSPALRRYRQVAGMLTGKRSAKAEDGAAWVRALGEELDVRPLGEYGLRAKDFKRLVEQSQKANSMKGNAIGLADDEILNLLNSAI